MRLSERQHAATGIMAMTSSESSASLLQHIGRQAKSTTAWRTLRFVVLLAAISTTPRAAEAQLIPLFPPPTPDRCLRSRPALTYSAASGAPERGDSSWAIVGLFADGRVTRPLLPPQRYDRSTWRMQGDSLHLRVFDCLVGWNVAAVGDSLGYTGIATYLTDVVVAGAQPHRIPVHLEPTPCPTTRPR